jgi:hypothetical protein
MSAALDLGLLDQYAAGLDGMNAHDDFSVREVARSSAPADTAEVGVAEGCRIFEAVAERPVEADVRGQNETRGP